MSATRTTEIRCDEPDGNDVCGNAVHDYGTAAEVREHAKRQGWDVGLPGGKDRCDVCVRAIARLEAHR